MLKNRIFLTVMFWVYAVTVGMLFAQEEHKPFVGRFFCPETNITFDMDLYNETLEVPNLGFLGKVNGYLSGRGVYGVWIITTCGINSNIANIRLSDDMGSDTQEVCFRLLNDSLFEYKAIGGNKVRKAVGRKLVKVPDTMIFKKL